MVLALQRAHRGVAGPDAAESSAVDVERQRRQRLLPGPARLVLAAGTVDLAGDGQRVWLAHQDQRRAGPALDGKRHRHRRWVRFERRPAAEETTLMVEIEWPERAHREGGHRPKA